MRKKMVDVTFTLFNFLLVMLVVLALIVVELKDLLYAAIVAAFYSVIVAVLYFMLQAPDIALTQVVVGVGLQTAIIIITISKTRRMEEDSPGNPYLKAGIIMLSIILMVVFAFTFLYDFPAFGEPVARVGQYYVENVLKDVGAWNAVGAIVWDYRGYDTLGETLVLFTAVIIVLAVLRHEG